jgi:NTE family protein
VAKRPIRDLFRRPGKVAFVLGGGGNLGALQVGMLRALTERSIAPDLIVGCSAGAINGAAFAASPDMNGVYRLEEIWRSLHELDIMPDGFLPGPVALARKGDAVHSNDRLRDLLERNVPDLRFEDLRVPFQCVATEIDHAEEHWFSSGELIEPLLASSAIPALYPIVQLDGSRYMDGGVVNDVPISRAVELGAKSIYVLHVGVHDRPMPEPRRPFEVAVMAYWIARRQRFLRDLRALPKSITVTVLPAGMAPSLRYDDFSKSEELMAQAYLDTLAHLDAQSGAAPAIADINVPTVPQLGG